MAPLQPRAASEAVQQQVSVRTVSAGVQQVLRILRMHPRLRWCQIYILHWGLLRTRLNGMPRQRSSPHTCMDTLAARAPHMLRVLMLAICHSNIKTRSCVLQVHCHPPHLPRSECQRRTVYTALCVLPAVCAIQGLAYSSIRECITRADYTCLCLWAAAARVRPWWDCDCAHHKLGRRVGLKHATTDLRDLQWLTLTSPTQISSYCVQALLVAASAH